MSKLIPCKSCNHQVSFSAKACPGCGHDLEKDRQNQKNLVQTIVLVGLLLIVVVLFKTGLADTLLQQISLLKALKPQN